MFLPVEYACKHKCIKSILAFANNMQGAISVEFAFIGPLFMFFMINIFAGAIYLAAFHKLEHVTAQAARASIAGMSDTERRTLVQQSLNQTLEDALLLQASAINVSVSSSSGDRKRYRVSLTFDTRTLGLSGIPGVSALAPATLTSSYDVRNGGL